MRIGIRRAACTALLAGGLVAGAAGTASAVVEYVGGGVWDHGIVNSRVYSNYYHSSICHGSTAVGTTTVRATAGAGATSYASAPKAWTNNQTYYRTSC
ncbi:lactococcin 972 family bacteriocin [Nocardiopsis sp. Huas11]|uniref:lactococcin 972 family bacteriocin n=1 Tax=Nocardiopsis sp. Huas11 TaxID=2183912 RepID=UPI000EAE4C6D|nr:lactococcin 972 family bacteriocin [Nocardiopsis sp. Huas11]RKS10276.1 lactococcin 972 family bacteriocin [Nocardiopsis sp. Huas11]